MGEAMTDKKLAKANELQRKITNLNDDIKMMDAKSVIIHAYHQGYEYKINNVSGEARNIIKTIVRADLDKQIADAQKEYEAL